LIKGDQFRYFGISSANTRIYIEISPCLCWQRRSSLKRGCKVKQLTRSTEYYGKTHLKHLCEVQAMRKPGVCRSATVRTRNPRGPLPTITIHAQIENLNIVDNERAGQEERVISAKVSISSLLQFKSILSGWEPTDEINVFMAVGPDHTIRLPKLKSPNFDDAYAAFKKLILEPSA